MSIPSADELWPEDEPEAHERPLYALESDATDGGLLVDWDTFWSIDHDAAEWLAEPIVAAKRSTALFAPGGTGKSLLSLYISARLATGGMLFGAPVQPINVLYLDYEMTADDLAERLEAMGYGPDSDLSHLHYALLPSLPGLDEPEGGKVVVELAESVDAQLVVIDTFGRAVHGDENDADTVRAWYRWTGLHLKYAGRAFMRVDHAGKDITKGQRGTSAKNDDVDVVWQMTAKDAGAFTLTAKKRRMGWVPQTVDLVMLEDDVMRFELPAGRVWPKGTSEVAARLDALGLPVDISQRKAAAAIRESGMRTRSDTIRAAVRYRHERSITFHFVSDEAATESGKSAPHESGRAQRARRAPNDPGAIAKMPSDLHGRTSGRAGAHHADATGAQCASLREAHAPSVDPERPETDDNSDPDYPF